MLIDGSKNVIIGGDLDFRLKGTVSFHTCLGDWLSANFHPSLHSKKYPYSSHGSRDGSRILREGVVSHHESLMGVRE